MKYIKILVILLVLQILMAVPLYTQEDEESDITKYTIREYLEANLPPQEGRKIILDEITGLLTITDTPKNQEIALRLIREWDVGPKQIQIEAKFIEITFTDLNEMGVDWQFLRTDQPMISSIVTEVIDETPLTGALAGMMGTGSSPLGFATAADPAGLGLMIGKAMLSGNTLRAYLKALEQAGKVNLLNAPRITTLSGQMANLQVVKSFPYATSVERTQVEMGTYEYDDDEGNTVIVTLTFPVETYEIEEEIVGVSLEVTPIVIEGSDIITLEIHPEVTKLSQQVSLSATSPDDLGWPIIDTRSIQTSVMVRSGETVVLGGLIQDADENTVERKIPFLGDIPFIGNLFRYKYEKREKKNLVIFLTARLIDTEGEGL